MKKIIYIMALIFIGFMVSPDVRANPNTCVYEYNGTIIKVYQSAVDKEKAYIEVNDDSAKKSKVDVVDGKEITTYYTYTSYLKSSDFFDGVNFQCSSINVLIKNGSETSNATKKNVSVYFEDNKTICKDGFFVNSRTDCDSYETIEVKEYWTNESTCTYKIRNDNFISTLIVSNKGNGKIGTSTSTEARGISKEHIKIDDGIFFKDGIFHCSDVKVIGEACTYSGTDRMDIYWKSSADTKSYCTGTKLATSEETIAEPGETIIDDDDGTSKWNFTDGKTIEFVKKIYSIVKIVVPVLIIVLSIVDFIKVLLLSDDKNYKAAFNKFIKRIVIGIIFFLVPVLISLILDLSGLGDSGILNVFK